MLWCRELLPRSNHFCNCCRRHLFRCCPHSLAAVPGAEMSDCGNWKQYKWTLFISGCCCCCPCCCGGCWCCRTCRAGSSRAIVGVSELRALSSGLSTHPAHPPWLLTPPTILSHISWWNIRCLPRQPRYRDMRYFSDWTRLSSTWSGSYSQSTDSNALKFVKIPGNSLGFSDIPEETSSQVARYANWKADKLRCSQAEANWHHHYHHYHRSSCQTDMVAW